VNVRNNLFLGDPLETPLTATYDPDNRLIGTVGPTSIPITYAYDAIGQRAQLAVPTGLFSYTFDAANRLTLMINPQGDHTSYRYDLASRVTAGDSGDSDTGDSDTGDSDTQRLGGFRHPKTWGFRHPKTWGGFRHPKTWGGFRGDSDTQGGGFRHPKTWGFREFRGDSDTQRLGDSDTQRLGGDSEGIQTPRGGDSDTQRLGDSGDSEGIQTPKDLGIQTPKDLGDSDTQRLGGFGGGFRHPKTCGGFRHPKTWGDSDTQRLGGFRGDSDAQSLVEGQLARTAIAALGRCSETRPLVTADVCARSIEVRRRVGCPVGLRTEVIGAHEAATLPNESVMETRVD
jgi:YD repeat-containing protein